MEPGALATLASVRPAFDDKWNGDLNGGEIAFALRHSATPLRTKTSLDDLAQIALCALRCSLALIVIDSASPGWSQRRTGVATTANDTTATDRDVTDWARMVDPLMAGDAGFGFYAAVPLRDGAGLRIGTLAMLGKAPRAVSEEELATFRKLAGMVERLV